MTVLTVADHCVDPNFQFTLGTWKELYIALTGEEDIHWSERHISLAINTKLRDATTIVCDCAVKDKSFARPVIMLCRNFCRYIAQHDSNAKALLNGMASIPNDCEFIRWFSNNYKTMDVVLY